MRIERLATSCIVSCLVFISRIALDTTIKLTLHYTLNPSHISRTLPHFARLFNSAHVTYLEVFLHFDTFL